MLVFIKITYKSSTGSRHHFLLLWAPNRSTLFMSLVFSNFEKTVERAFSISSCFLVCLRLLYPPSTSSRSTLYLRHCSISLYIKLQNEPSVPIRLFSLLWKPVKYFRCIALYQMFEESNRNKQKVFKNIKIKFFVFWNQNSPIFFQCWYRKYNGNNFKLVLLAAAKNCCRLQLVFLNKVTFH